MDTFNLIMKMDLFEEVPKLEILLIIYLIKNVL